MGVQLSNTSLSATTWQDYSWTGFSSYQVERWKFPYTQRMTIKIKLIVKLLRKTSLEWDAAALTCPPCAPSFNVLSSDVVDFTEHEDRHAGPPRWLPSCRHQGLPALKGNFLVFSN